MNLAAQKGDRDNGHPGRAGLTGLPVFACLRLVAAAALAVALGECSGGDRVGLPGAVPKDKCPISHALLGGVWALDFGTGGPTSVLAGCGDASPLNGRPVYVRGDYACLSILPCPAVVSFDTQVVLDIDFDRGLIVVQGQGAISGSTLSAEIRTSACLVAFEFRQPGVNDPLTMDIHCGGGLDEKSGTMDAVCQIATVNDDGKYTDCGIDPPLLPTVRLRTDTGP